MAKPLTSKWWRLLRYDLPLHFVLLLTNWLPDNTPFLQLRGKWVRLFLGSCGSNLELGRNVTFYNPSAIHLGADVYIAYGCVFLASGEINVGDQVLFGPYVVVSSGNHTLSGNSYRFGDAELLPIKIGTGTWIGAHTTVLGGAQIEEGCLVASNAAVVRGRIAAHSIAGGVPAQVLRRREG